jgi:3'(2'), 5'-bisphosphate nucleotidase
MTGAPETQPNIAAVCTLAKRAGMHIMRYYNSQQQTSSEQKANNTPVTPADLLAHDTIKAGLGELTPAIPLLSEEAVIAPFAERQSWPMYWLVDPLDGTREFLRKSGDFSVNIALISDHQPVLGVVYMPVYDVCYFAQQGAGAFVQYHDQPSQQITTRAVAEPLTVLVSRSHKNERLAHFLRLHPDYQVIEMGSSYKCCQIAEGKADFYPRFSQTMEWDTAASHCILREAGGEIYAITGEPLSYNLKDDLINPAFIAVGDQHFDWFSSLKFDEST